MRRIFILILCLIVLLSGCKNKQDEEPEEIEATYNLTSVLGFGLPDVFSTQELTNKEIDDLIADNNLDDLKSKINTVADCINYFIRTPFQFIGMASSGEKCIADKAGDFFGMSRAMALLLCDDYEQIGTIHIVRSQDDFNFFLYIRNDGIYYCIDPLAYIQGKKRWMQDQPENGVYCSYKLSTIVESLKSYGDVQTDVLYSNIINNKVMVDGIEMIDINGYTIPAALGEQNLTNKQIDSLIKGNKLAALKKNINTVADCINYFVRSGFTFNGHSTSGQETIKEVAGDFFGMSRAMALLLSDDYEEIGTIHVSRSQDDFEFFLYIKCDGIYYTVDPVSYCLDRKTWMEGFDSKCVFIADKLDTIIKSFSSFGNIKTELLYENIIIEDNLNWDVISDDGDNLETIELTITDIQIKANEERRNNVNLTSNIVIPSDASKDGQVINQQEVTKLERYSHTSNYEILKATLSKQQALEDADLLNKAIISTYGSYYLYTPEQWQEAYNNVVADVNTFKTDKLTSDEFEEILLKNYCFVNDDHFRFNNTSTLAYNGGLYYYCYVKDLYFFKDSKGYFTYKANKKWYLTKVNETTDMTQLMKPTITEEGQLAYQIGVFLKDNDDFDVNIALSRGGQTNVIETKYTKSSSLRDRSSELSETQAGLYDGYYVMSIRSFNVENGQINSELMRYADEAAKLAGTSNFIIDSRSNGGGSDDYLERFFENYTGVKCQLNLFIVLRQSILNGYSSSQTTIQKQEGIYANNDNLFVYLIDKAVGSAGERGILSMRQMDNCLLVGTNSKGCILGDGSDTYRLPNSKIVCVIGQAAFVEGNCTSDIEGLGWMPDIYVDGYLALDRTIAMYQYYGLMPDENVGTLDVWGEEIPRFE